MFRIRFRNEIPDAVNDWRGPAPRQGMSAGGILTSIAVLALLVVLCLVAVAQGLGRAGEAERKSSCQNNLKELGIALIMYYGDYDAMLPSSFLYGRSKSWNKDDFMKFAKLRGTLPPPPDSKRSSWPMLFYPYLKNKDIIKCPSDSSQREDAGATVSYYYKAAIDAAWYGGPKGKGPVCRKEGDFDFPADQIVFYERAGWHWGDARKGLVNGVTINCCFLDGHVATKKIINSGYTTAEVPAEPLPKSRIGEPAWFNYDFVNAPMDASDRPITRTYGFTPAPNDAGWNPQKGGDNLP